MSNATTYTYAGGGNNELQSMTVSGGGTDSNVMSYTYDDWGAGFNVVSEEGTDGEEGFELARTYVAGLAEIAGVDPATGTPRYLTHDHLGSARGAWGDSSGSPVALGTFEYRA